MAEFLEGCLDNIRLQIPNEDGVHQNKKHTVSISPSRNGNTTYKEQTL